MGIPYIVMSVAGALFIVAGLIVLFVEGGNVKQRLPMALAGVAVFIAAATALWFFVEWLVVPER